MDGRLRTQQGDSHASGGWASGDRRPVRPRHTCRRCRHGETHAGAGNGIGLASGLPVIRPGREGCRFKPDPSLPSMLAVQTTFDNRSGNALHLLLRSQGLIDKDLFEPVVWLTCEKDQAPAKSSRMVVKARFWFWAPSLLAGPINTTLGAARFIAGSCQIYFPVETEPFAACSMREATARGCET